MRLLWIGDLASTGFGTVTMDTGRELVKMGIDARFLSQNDFDKLPEPFASRTLDVALFQNGANYNGDDAGVGDIRPHVQAILLGTGSDLPMANGEKWGDWKPDAVFLLGDFYGMREMVESYLDLFRRVPAFHYVPIEGRDLPPHWNGIWSVLKPIAMTHFGQDEIEKVIGYRPPMVYHGVDAETFHPVTPTEPIRMPETLADGRKAMRTLTSKAACKVFLFGDPNITVALRTDRFMPRKGYDTLIRAMAPVLRTHPSLVLALHCRSRDFGGYMPDILSKYMDIRDRIFVPDFFSMAPGGVPRPLLNVMYNAADLYVSVSAEGFGLTIAEALATGTPAVGLDYSAVPEVIGPAGRTVPIGKTLDNEYAHQWALPDEEEYARAVTYLIEHPHKRLELGRQGPAHVRKHFSWAVAAERFVAIAQKALQPSSIQEPVKEPAMVAA